MSAVMRVCSAKWAVWADWRVLQLLLLMLVLQWPPLCMSPLSGPHKWVGHAGRP